MPFIPCAIGINYLGSKFKISIRADKVKLICLTLNQFQPLQIVLDNETSFILIESEICKCIKRWEDVFIIVWCFIDDITMKKIFIQPIDTNFGDCKVPADIIGIRKD